MKTFLLCLFMTEMLIYSIILTLNFKTNFENIIKNSIHKATPNSLIKHN